MSANIVELMRPGTLNLSSLPPLSVYLHLPWCLKKCPYCDFNSHEWRGSDSLSGGNLGRELESQYLDALSADLEAALPLIWGRSVHSIFIGGGTPSLFSESAIDRLLSDLRARLNLTAGIEITLEANPGTFEKNRFRAFRQAGVTRLSIGVQSFNDAYLKTLGRVHDRKQAIAAVEEASQCFDTFNIDLMYALPGQTVQDLKQDLAQALSVCPPHLSIYHLTIEPQTVFAKYPPKNLPDEDTAYAMLDLITEQTGLAGLQRYEVSAFAKPGHRCWHNLNYWQFGDYLGIGAGAHSKISFPHRILRQVRWKEPQRYMQGALAADAVSSSEEVNRADLPFEFMLNALRLREGFATGLFAERTGLPVNSVQAAMQKAEALGLLKLDLNHIQPSEKGFDFLSNLLEMFLPVGKTVKD
jgi:oxygen-independent coproporphyrinogen-3 oxidase